MTPFIFSDIEGSRAFLYGEEAKHCKKVMRKRAGEDILGIDGKGKMYRARIKALDKHQIELEIHGEKFDWGEKPQYIRLLVSPLHKPDRFEWLLEKSVELGGQTYGQNWIAHSPPGTDHARGPETIVAQPLA